MNRTKPPALTSPSKIGFFVSLMLVFVSVGVTYFFVHQFEVSWNWLDRNEWTGVLKGEGFLFDMLPLLAVIVVSSLISYLVIVGAVRKYKRYLDSGLDYRNLLSKLKDIDTLEDKTKIEKLQNHPELKRLLLGLSDGLAERNRELDERQTKLEQEAADAVGTKEEELAGEFSRQCDVLADAIANGAESLLDASDDISNQGLQRISEAVQRTAESVPKSDDWDLADSYGDLRKTSDVLQARLREIATEMNDAGTGAKEIEEQIKHFAGTDTANSDENRLDSAREEVREILGHFESLEELSASLAAFSEEAKGIAINTALQAGSGEGTQDDLIRLAEEVKGVAGRFRDGTRRFTEASAKMRSSMGALDTFVGREISPQEGVSSLEQRLSALGMKASLWVERVVVLSDKVSNLRETLDVSMTGHPDATQEDVVETDVAQRAPEVPDESDDFEFESLERTRAIFDESPLEKEVSEEEPVATDDSVINKGMPFEQEQVTDISDLDQEDSEEVTQPDENILDVPGFETFSTGAAKGKPAYDDKPLKRDELDVDADRPMPGAFPPADGLTERYNLDEEPSDDAPELPPVAKRDFSPADDMDLPPGNFENKTEESVAIDLYELGAVDYDPAVHG